MSPLEAACFISYASMTIACLWAHFRVTARPIFLIAAKIYGVCGIIGMHNIGFRNGKYNHALFVIYYIEYISSINLITAEISLGNGSHWGTVVLILIPTYFDLAIKIVDPDVIPVTSITNYLSVFHITQFAFRNEDRTLWMIGSLNVIPHVYRQSAWKNRFIKAVAMYYATQYFVSIKYRLFSRI